MSQQQQPPTPEQIADALYRVASKDSDFEVFILRDGGRVIVVKPKPAPRFDAFIKSLGPPGRGQRRAAHELSRGSSLRFWPDD